MVMLTFSRKIAVARGMARATLLAELRSSPKGTPHGPNEVVAFVFYFVLYRAW